MSDWRPSLPARIDIKSASEVEAEKAAHKIEEAVAREKAGAVEAAIEEIEAQAALPAEQPVVEEAAELEPVAEEAEAQPAGVGIDILAPLEVSAATGPSKIRFAEEILAGREGKSKKKETKKEADGKDSGAKVKKAKHKKATYIEDDDFER